MLRENLILSVLASLIGLPLGPLFHRIALGSYALALICTMLFAIIVNLVMKRQIGKIPVAESLKVVE